MSRFSVMEKGGCQVLAQLLYMCFLLGFIIALEMLQVTVLVLNLFTSPFRKVFESSSDFHYLVMRVASIFQLRKWGLWSSGQKKLMNHEKEVNFMWCGHCPHCWTVKSACPWNWHNRRELQAVGAGCIDGGWQRGASQEETETASAIGGVWKKHPWEDKNVLSLPKEHKSRWWRRSAGADDTKTFLPFLFCIMTFTEYWTVLNNQRTTLFPIIIHHCFFPMVSWEFKRFYTRAKSIQGSKTKGSNTITLLNLSYLYIMHFIYPEWAFIFFKVLPITISI